MKVILYSTNCPRCKVLKTKLEQKKIQYEECNDINEMLKLNIKMAPMLQVDQSLLNFSYAVKWINSIDAETVADASVDGNANVGSKDMRTLMNEMPKSHRKLLAYNKIYYELNKKYGFKTANDWLNKEWIKALYMHD